MRRSLTEGPRVRKAEWNSSAISDQSLKSLMKSPAEQ